ncbi:MAG: hypothetical protein WC628_08820 [Candidatus Omnitrophota bacterium]
MRKKKWERPKLVVLLRMKPENAVLSKCHGGMENGSADEHSGCITVVDWYDAAGAYLPGMAGETYIGCTYTDLGDPVGLYKCETITNGYVSSPTYRHTCGGCEFIASS